MKIFGLCLIGILLMAMFAVAGIVAGEVSDYTFDFTDDIVERMFREAQKYKTHLYACPDPATEDNIRSMDFSDTGKTLSETEIRSAVEECKTVGSFHVAARPYENDILECKEWIIGELKERGFISIESDTFEQDYQCHLIKEFRKFYSDSFKEKPEYMEGLIEEHLDAVAENNMKPPNIVEINLDPSLKISEEGIGETEEIGIKKIEGSVREIERIEEYEDGSISVFIEGQEMVLKTKDGYVEADFQGTKTKIMGSISITKSGLSFNDGNGERQIGVLPSEIPEKTSIKNPDYITLDSTDDGVYYETEGKREIAVFGFMPVSFDAKAKINAYTSQIEFEQPWWANILSWVSM